MKIQLLRHATALLSIGQKKLLLDPMLSPAGTMPAIVNSPNARPNPLVELPFTREEMQELLRGVDGILLTHTHRDHFDEAAKELIPKNTPIFCQREDAAKLLELGFSTVYPIEESYSWQEMKISRTDGRHGTGEIGKKMAPVSGYVLQTPGEPSLYICGDTIWCPEVEGALVDYKPQVIIAFAGAAQFLTGDPITMTAEDIANLCAKGPRSKVVAIHLDSINHCLLTRSQLASFLEERDLVDQVFIPQDGEEIEFK